MIMRRQNGSSPPTDVDTTPHRGGPRTAMSAAFLGGLALVTSFAAYSAVLLGAVAVVFGSVSAARARRGSSSRKLALAGVCCGALGVAIAMALMFSR